MLNVPKQAESVNKHSFLSDVKSISVILAPTQFTSLSFQHKKENLVSTNLKERFFFCKSGKLGVGAPQRPAFSHFLLSVLLQR